MRSLDWTGTNSPGVIRSAFRTCFSSNLQEKRSEYTIQHHSPKLVFLFPLVSLIFSFPSTYTTMTQTKHFKVKVWRLSSCSFWSLSRDERLFELISISFHDSWSHIWILRNLYDRQIDQLLRCCIILVRLAVDAVDLMIFVELRSSPCCFVLDSWTIEHWELSKWPFVLERKRQECQQNKYLEFFIEKRIFWSRIVVWKHVLMTWFAEK